MALATLVYAHDHTSALQVLRLRLKIKQDHTAWRDRDGTRNTGG